MSSYPKWLYHRDYPPFIVETASEHDAAREDGWVESPADLPSDVGDASAPKKKTRAKGSVS